MSIRRGPLKPTIPIITDGLVFYVDAANPKSYVSGSTTTDSLVGNITGSLINDTSFSTDAQGTWVFDGTDDAILISRSDSIEPDLITVGCWVKCETQSQYYAYIVSKGYDGSGDSYAFYFGGTLNSIRFYVKSSSGLKLSSFTPIDDNTWHYVVGTYDGSYVRLYVDSLEIGSGVAHSGNILYNALDLNLGKWSGDTLQPFSYEYNGNISNTHIYNRTLSPTEVQQNYNALKGRFGLWAEE